MLARRSGFACARLLALMLAVSLIPASASAMPQARAARSVKLSESGHLHGTSGSGPHINGQGTLAGTIHGPVYIHLLVGPGRTFTAEVNVYPRKGSLSGLGTGRYRVGDGTYVVQFSGSLSISRGTGRYARARAHDLSFKGSVNLLDGAVTLKLSGTLRY